jgi:hypothetical protein
VLGAECTALHCFLFLPASYLEQRHRPEARNYFYWDSVRWAKNLKLGGNLCVKTCP